MSQAVLTEARKPALGIDDGTFTLVVARRDPEGNIRYKTEVNGFMEIEINDRTKIMLSLIKKEAPVYIPEGSNMAYVMGNRARRIAYSLSSVMKKETGGSVFQRTMREGVLSVSDSRQSFNLLATMLRSLASPLPADRCPLAFACPGDPINKPGYDVNYHRMVMEQILSDVDGKRPDAFPVNEAQAIIWSECREENYTGFSMSWGAGMVNVCFSVMGYPIFSFSHVGGGDWIDEQAALHSGTDPVVINETKMGSETTPGINLMDKPSGGDEHIRRAIVNHYDLLTDYVVNATAKHIKAHEQRVAEVDKPCVIIAGGTSSPNGFLEMVESKMRKANFGSFSFGEFRRAKEPLYAVARGLLIAAEELER